MKKLQRKYNSSSSHHLAFARYNRYNPKSKEKVKKKRKNLYIFRPIPIGPIMAIIITFDVLVNSSQETLFLQKKKKRLNVKARIIDISI